MTERRAPSQQTLSRFLGDFLGRKVDVNKVSDTPKYAGGLAATYVEQAGAPALVFWCDVAAAASLGAALSMMPKGPADEAAASGALRDLLAENYYEVCNVLTSLFNSLAGECEAVTFSGLHSGAEADATMRDAPGLAAAMCVTLQVQGYEPGTACITLA